MFDIGIRMPHLSDLGEKSAHKMYFGNVKEVCRMVSKILTRSFESFEGTLKHCKLYIFFQEVLSTMNEYKKEKISPLEDFAMKFDLNVT